MCAVEFMRFGLDRVDTRTIWVPVLSLRRTGIRMHRALNRGSTNGIGWVVGVGFTGANRFGGGGGRGEEVVG